MREKAVKVTSVTASRGCRVPTEHAEMNDQSLLLALHSHRFELVAVLPADQLGKAGGLPA
jgi:hypothetical protein